MLFAAGAFFASFFIAHYVPHSRIVRLNWILLVLLIIFYGITHYRYNERQKKTRRRVPVKPATLQFHKTAIKQIINDTESSSIHTSEIRIGLFAPQLHEHPTLYFYRVENFEWGLSGLIKIDSVLFTNDEYNNPSIDYAPPGLYPEQLKLNYAIIVFKVLGVGRDFNEQPRGRASRYPLPL